MKWPIYMDGMIEGYIIDSNFFAPWIRNGWILPPLVMVLPGGGCVRPVVKHSKPAPES